MLGSSGKGHEFMLKYLLGTEHGIQVRLGRQGGVSRKKWTGRTMVWKASWIWSFHWTSVCRAPVSSDIILPTATWYEKTDMNTSDMHPFIPAVCGGRSGREAKSDWESTKPSRRNSPKCASAIWVKKPTSSRCLSS
ncbi:molybdopterin-dependent oxidoreductase, partial [Escherichia coli]